MVSNDSSAPQDFPFYVLRGGRRLGAGRRQDTRNALIRVRLIQSAHPVQLVLLFEKRLDVRGERRVRAAVRGHRQVMDFFGGRQRSYDHEQDNQMTGNHPGGSALAKGKKTSY